MRRLILGCGLLLAVLIAAATAVHGGGGAPARAARQSPSETSPVVDNRLVAFARVRRTVLAGAERDPETHKRLRIRVDSRVLRKRRTIGGIRVRTPAGTFRNCIRTKDFSPLDSIVEHKHYCPGVGLVREREPGSIANLVLYKR